MPGNPASLKRALKAYVEGHDRGWTVERKRSAATSSPDEAGTPRFDERAGRSEPRVNIPVPARLEYHRGPDTWRRRAPGRADADSRG